MEHLSSFINEFMLVMGRRRSG